MRSSVQVTQAALIAILCASFAHVAFAGPGGSSPVVLDVAMDRPTLLADKTQVAYVWVGLTGHATERDERRAPVNIAVVIDKSGSMSGRKIDKAREAAIMAIDRLNAEDIISVITYDSTVNVLVPATKASNKQAIFRMVRNIKAGGRTALFAGASKGATELRKFLGKERVNRLVLLSDGLANVGPSSPTELGSLGASLIKECISVTTIGLGMGYNEDLMTQLAYKSDGSHYFAEDAEELADVFDSEFGRALSVVAQGLRIDIRCARGIRPVRVLGRESQINGQDVLVFINHLYREHQKAVVLEVEVPAAPHDNSTRKIATIHVGYNNVTTRVAGALNRALDVTFSHSQKVVDKWANGKVMVDVVELIAADQNELAMRLRDKGDIDEARRVLSLNEQYLHGNADRYQSKRLREYATEQSGAIANLKEEDWGKQRKIMQESQQSRRVRR